MTTDATTYSVEVERRAARYLELCAAYDAGAPLVPDDVFDAFEAAFRKSAPTHPALKKVGSPVPRESLVNFGGALSTVTVTGWSTVTHIVLMGSLAKAQLDEEFVAWEDALPMRPTDDLFLTEKLDGMSIMLTYTGGKLVQASTRGDGVEGEDITRNVRIMQGVPSSIPETEETVYIRGEVVCRKSDFAKFFAGESNPRNTATGTSKRQTGWTKARHLTVYAYNLTYAFPGNSVIDRVPGSKGVNLPFGLTHRSYEFGALKDWGFLVPNHFVCSNSTEVCTIRDNYIAKTRDLVDYLIDGLVCEINDTALRESLGESDMRPRGAIAFKFPSESQSTILAGLKWQVGNSGRVTPVAEFESVYLAGANIKQASVHNVSYIGRLLVDHPDATCLNVGDEILVSRRNDVIPQVETVLTKNPVGAALLPPAVCPACGFALEKVGEYLVCYGEDCSATVIGSLKRWVGKLNILHFGDTLLAAVIEAGMVKTIGDLYRLKESEVAALELDGRRVGGSAKRALDNLHSNKALTLDLFVGSLGIPLVGRKMTKLLMEGGVDDLDKMARATVAQMSAIPGFGQGRAEAFRKGFDERKTLIFEILAAGVTLVEPVKVVQTGTAMAGKSVCMTGFRDAEMETAIVAAGGKVASGVNKKLSILVTKDPNSTSGKAQEARALGLTILSRDEMWALLGKS